MRNFTKLLGIVALVASIVFSMAACDDDGNGGDGTAPAITTTSFIQCGGLG